jgi:DNA-binding NarL/FixJ family response regulator
VGCRELEERLVRAGCFVISAASGSEAILRVRHEKLDAAILVSTGAEMDVAETALNVRDVNSALDIIIVVSKRDEEESFPADVIAYAIPKTKVLTDDELSDYLGLDTDRLRTKR